MDGSLTPSGDPKPDASTQNAYIALFSYVSFAVFIIFVANIIRSFQNSEKETFRNFLESNIMRKNEKTRDLVYYKILKSPKFLAITRKDALLYVSVLIVSGYNYVGYLHTHDKSELIAAIIPFVMYGIFSTTATHTKAANGRWVVALESLANTMFTVSTLLACEIVRETFTMPLYVPFVMIVLSLMIQIMSVYRNNVDIREDQKTTVNVGFKPELTRHLAANGFETESEPAVANWTLDTKTFVVFSILDLVIIFVPVFIFGLMFSLKQYVSHWEYSILALFVPPLFYWVFQLVILFGNGWNARVFFNLVLSTMTFVTVLMTFLYSINAFGSTDRFELIIGVPMFFTLLLFLIAIVYKNPVTVPFLSVSCVATDKDGKECVFKKSQNVQTQDQVAIIETEMASMGKKNPA
jgi:hypothetical protein